MSRAGRFLHSAGSAARRQLPSKTGEGGNYIITPPNPVFDQKRWNEVEPLARRNLPALVICMIDKEAWNANA